jgi:heme/copper-type cytochrome/quinol oxidase subunit 1
VDLGCSVRSSISLHVGFGYWYCGMGTLYLVVSFAVLCRRGQLVLFNYGVPVDWVVGWYEMPPLSAMPQGKGEFDLAISAAERPQTYALDRTATALAH